MAQAQTQRPLTLQDTIDVWLRATRDIDKGGLTSEAYEGLERVRDESLGLIGAATAQRESLSAAREARRFLSAVGRYEGELPAPMSPEEAMMGVERPEPPSLFAPDGGLYQTTTTEPSGPAQLSEGLTTLAKTAAIPGTGAFLAKEGLRSLARAPLGLSPTVPGLGEILEAFKPGAEAGYRLDPEGASYVVNRDLPRKAYLADMMAGQIIPGPEGGRAVQTRDPATLEPIFVEIPESAIGPKGERHGIAEYADSVFRARAGVKEGTGAFLQTSGIVGALVHRIGDGKKGWDRDVVDVFGNTWPYIPKITGNRDLDRSRLMEDPAYTRALYETKPGFPAVMGVVAAGQTTAIAETVALEALTAGVGRAAGKGGSLARKLLPARMAEGSTAMAELLGTRTAAQVLRGARGLPEGGVLRRYVVPGLGIGAANLRQEITYGVVQAVAAGTPWTEGFSQGLSEGMTENVFGFASRRALKGLGMANSRLLGGAWSRLASRPGAFQSPAKFMERLPFKTPPQYAQYLLDALPSRKLSVSSEIAGFFKSKETGERMLQLYDIATLSYLHGGMQAAQAKAASKGRAWDQIPVLERAALVLDPANLESPEVAGMALAFLGGGMAQYGLDRGGITNQALKAEQQLRLKEILDALPATTLANPEEAMRIVAGAIETDDALQAELEDLRRLTDEFDPDRFVAENPGVDPREHIERLVNVQRDLTEAFRDEIAEAPPESRDLVTGEILARYLDAETIHNPGRLRQVEQEARARILNDPDPRPVRFAGEAVTGQGGAAESPLAPPPANDPRPSIQRGAAAFNWSFNPTVYDDVAREDYTRLKVMRFDVNREENELLDGAILATGGDRSKVTKLSRDLTKEQNRGLRGEGREIGRFPTEQSLRKDVARTTKKYASRVRPELEGLVLADGTRMFPVEQLQDHRTLLPFVMAWAGVGYQRGTPGDARPPTVIDKMARKVARAIGHEGKVTRPNDMLDGRSPMDVAMEVFSRLQGENPAGHIRSARADDLIRTVQERTSGEGLARIVRASDDYTREPTRAFHGTAAEFNAFSDEFIGTGEGRQAFGVGHYLSSRRGIAEHYRAQEARTKGHKWLRDGKEVASPTDPAQAKAWSLISARAGDVWADPRKAVSRARADAAAMEGAAVAAGDFGHANLLAKVRRFIVAEEGHTFTRIDSGGRVYHVEIAPEESEFLLWDRPLSEQSARVQAALSRLPSAPRLSSSKTGGGLYAALSGRGAKRASESLRSVGVRGIKYLDAPSRAKGAGSFNYVVFDPADITILGEPGAPTQREAAPATQTLAPRAPKGLSPLTRGAAQAVRRSDARMGRAVEILREQVEAAANLHPADDRMRAMLSGLVRGDPAVAAMFADPSQFKLAVREAQKAQLYAQEAALLVARGDPDWWRTGSLILRGLDAEGDPAGLSASLVQELDAAGLLERRMVGGRPLDRVDPRAIDGFLQRLSLEGLRHPGGFQGNLVDLVTGYAHAFWQPSALTMGWAHRQLANLGNRWDRFAEKWLDPHAWAERSLQKDALGPVGWILSRTLRGARKGEPSKLAPLRLGRRERGFGKVTRERRDAAFRKTEEANAQSRAMEWLAQIGEINEQVDAVAQGNRRYSRLFGLLVSNGGKIVIRSEADLVRRYGDRYGPQVGRLFPLLQRYTLAVNSMGIDGVRQGKLTPSQYRRMRDRYLMRVSINKDPDKAYDEYLSTLSRGMRDLSGGWQMHRAALDENRRVIYDFGFVAPRQAVIEATGLRFARVLHANADPGYSYTPSEAQALGIPEHVFQTGYTRVADRSGDAYQRGIHAHLHDQLGKMVRGELPATPKMMRTVTRLLGATVNADGSITEDPALAAHTDVASFQSLVRLFNQTLGDPPGTAIGQAAVDALMLWRSGKTAMNPKHLMLNITTSPLLNSLIGGAPFSDFVTSFTLGRGFYADGAKGMIDWSDWNKRGRDPAWIQTLSPERRALVLKLDEGVRTLGGNNFVAAFLQEDSMQELVRAVTNTQVAPGATLDEQQAFAAWLGPTQDDRRRAGPREIARLAGASDPRLVAKSWGQALTHYQTVELYFKLSNALYLESAKGIPWPEAVNAAAVGTADYNDANPTISDFLSNYRATEWEVFREMRRRGAQPSPLDPSENRAWIRPLLGRPFLTFGMLTTPSLAWGAVLRPQRALANMLVTAGVTTAISAALAQLGDDEGLDEALLDSPQLAGADVQRYYEQWYGKNSDVQLAAEPTGFWPRIKVSDLIERVGSGRAFMGISLPRGGRQRVLDLADYAPQAELVEKGLRAASTVGAMLKGEGAPPDEYGQQRTILGVLPAAGFEIADLALRTLRQQKGRTRAEQAAEIESAVSRSFGAAGSPFSWFISPQVQGLLLAGPGGGKTIFETMRGIRLPAAEDQGAGERMAESVLSSLLKVRTVAPYSKRSAETWYDDVGASLWGDNFHPDDSTRTGRSRIEEIATDRTLEQVSKLVRDAYAIYRSDLTGYSGGFDNLLEHFLYVQRDIDPETDRLVRSPTSELGKFIAGQPAEYQDASLYAAQRFLKEHVFNPENASVQTLAMLDRQKTLSVPLAERAFRASVRSSQGPLLDLLHERMVAKKDTDNASAWYQLFLTLDPPDHPNPRWSSFGDYRELAQAFYDLGAGDDWAFPDPEKVFGAAGPRLYDVAPTEALRLREQVPALLRR